MTEPLDDRSKLAIAYGWAWKGITISLEMAVPPLLGHLVDRYLGTRVVFVLLGSCLGMALGMWHLMHMSSPTKNPGVHKSEAFKTNEKPPAS